MLSLNDYVILINRIKNIEINSIGIIKDIFNDKNCYKILFIGKDIEVITPFDFVRLIDLNKTGKGFEYKICNICYILKKESEDFEINQTDSKGRKTTRPTCKKCREYINGIPLKPSENKRMLAIRPKHFFTCPICNKSSIPGITAKIVIDHDHDTGNARTWICDSCNTGLGRFKDSIALLKNAIRYLESFTK